MVASDILGGSFSFIRNCKSNFASVASYLCGRRQETFRSRDFSAIRVLCRCSLPDSDLRYSQKHLVIEQRGVLRKLVPSESSFCFWRLRGTTHHRFDNRVTHRTEIGVIPGRQHGIGLSRVNRSGSVPRQVKRGGLRQLPGIKTRLRKTATGVASNMTTRIALSLARLIHPLHFPVAHKPLYINPS